MQPKTAVRAATLQTAIPVFKLLKAPLLLPLNEVGEGPAEPEPDTLVPEVATEVNHLVDLSTLNNPRELTFQLLAVQVKYLNCNDTSKSICNSL